MAPESPGVSSAMLGDDVCPDPVQPGPGVLALQVEAPAAFESYPEDLPKEALGLGRVDPPNQESQKGRAVAIEDDPKRPGVLER